MNLAPLPRPTDAEVVAGYAAEALRDGRYALGQALAKIAIYAEQHEPRRRVDAAVHVPFAGPTRTEQPVRDFYDPRTAPRVVHPVVVNGGGPTGHGDADLEAAAIGVHLEQTAIMPRPDTYDPSPTLAPDSARCVARVTRDGIVEECHVVAYWVHGHVGDADTPAKQAGWRHIDPAVDQHHTPEINL